MAKKEAAKTVETKTVNTGFVDNVEALEAKMKEMREAQKIFATFTQEQVDKIFYEAAMAANKQRIPLARLAVEETQRGILEDKVIKNHYAAEYIYNAYKDTKTCGVVEEDKAFGIKKIAEPIGLVAAVIPTTNPTSRTTLAAAIVDALAAGCGLMMIAFLVFKQISVLKIAVDVGFVVGITAATRPTGSAIFLIPYALSSSITPHVQLQQQKLFLMQQ